MFKKIRCPIPKLHTEKVNMNKLRRKTWIIVLAYEKQEHARDPGKFYRSRPDKVSCISSLILTLYINEKKVIRLFQVSDQKLCLFSSEIRAWHGLLYFIANIDATYKRNVMLRIEPMALLFDCMFLGDDLPYNAGSEISYKACMPFICCFDLFIVGLFYGACQPETWPPIGFKTCVLNVFKLELNKLNYRNQIESFDKSRALICDYLHTKVRSRSLPLDTLYVIYGPKYAQFSKTLRLWPSLLPNFCGP
jgi:hypothetical protein